MEANRRDVLRWAVVGSVLLASEARADTPPDMAVFRDSNCGCCHKWVEHLQANGFAVTVHDVPSMKTVKVRLGVPFEIVSCHTGEIGGYVIEGHVPAAAIKRLLAEKPQGRGLAVPGMPIGSPGMEVDGREPETYDVLLFGGGGAPRRFATFRADKAV